MKVKEVIDFIDGTLVEILVNDGKSKFFVKQCKGDDLTPYYNDEVGFISWGHYEKNNPLSQYAILGISRK